MLKCNKPLVSFFIFIFYYYKAKISFFSPSASFQLIVFLFLFFFCFTFLTHITRPWLRSRICKNWHVAFLSQVLSKYCLKYFASFSFLREQKDAFILGFSNLRGKSYILKIVIIILKDTNVFSFFALFFLQLHKLLPTFMFCDCEVNFVLGFQHENFK